jgi:hypothetical protein
LVLSPRLQADITPHIPVMLRLTTYLKLPAIPLELGLRLSLGAFTPSEVTANGSLVFADEDLSWVDQWVENGGDGAVVWAAPGEAGPDRLYLVRADGC